jgi:hypothetical protein
MGQRNSTVKFVRNDDNVLAMFALGGAVSHHGRQAEYFAKATENG